MYVVQKEKERKKNNTKYSGHFVSLQRLRAAHALRSDQFKEKSEKYKALTTKFYEMKKRR